MFFKSPVMRLSMPITLKPSRINRSHKCDPKNPAAPVIRILFLFTLVFFNFSLPLSCLYFHNGSPNYSSFVSQISFCHQKLFY